MLPIITALLPVLGNVLDRVIPDKAEAEKARLEMEAKLLDAANAANLAQMEVNKAEAANASVFVSGWRPFIGWVGGAALAWHFVAGPAAVWGASVFGYAVPPLMPIDNGLWELVLAMLGIGGMRSWEKVRGVAK